LIFKIIKESTLFAWGSLVSNKLRTSLSLLGAVIGFFVIILVLACVDSLKKNIYDSIDSIGPNVVYVHKWSWEGGFDYPWWKYFLRPQPSVEEAELLIKRSYLSESITCAVDFNRPIRYRDNFLSNASIKGVWLNYEKVNEFNMESGRYFTDNEIRSGSTIAIIGYNIAQNIFEGQNPLGSMLKIKGRNFEVIGVLEKAGEGIFGSGQDETVYLPYYATNGMVDLNNFNVNQEIAIKRGNNITSQQIKDELTGLMRSIRKLKPSEEDNFSLNEASMAKKQLSGIVTMMQIVGWVIGLLAMLVGVFGVANIMFVSVKERTNLIGIQKALGAKRIFILVQFLIESIILSGMGCILGIILVNIIAAFIRSISTFDLRLSVTNVVLSLTISAFSGIIAGIIPAYTASRLDPVEAIRSK
jgi:putative ABC transport system permease protein